MKDQINKTKPCTCPKCGKKNTQIIQNPYPKYDKYTDTVTKWFICDDCLTEWYERYKLTYDGVDVLAFNYETLTNVKVEFNKDGKRYD
jgi:hypothetical protein